MTKTAKPARKWPTGRRRRPLPLLPDLQLDSLAEISPVWEVQPSGHREIGARVSVVRRDAQLRRGLATSDVISGFASLFVVTKSIDAGSVRLDLASLLVAPFILLAGKLIGLYDRDPHVLHKTTLDEAPSIGYFSVVFALGIWLCETVLLDGYLARPQVFGLLVLMFLMTTIGRLLVRRIAFVFAPAERCIVIGNATDAARIAAKLAHSPSVNAEVVGRVTLHPDEATEQIHSLPRLGEYGQLSQIVTRLQVERAIIAPRSDEQDGILEAIRLIKALGIKVSVLPRLLEVVGSTSTFDDIDGLWLLGVRQFGLARSSEMIKRSTDIAIAGLALILLWPLLLTLALAVKLDSDGPTFFRQARIGRRGERFWMLKFRRWSLTRKPETRPGRFQRGSGRPVQDHSDPPITRVGRSSVACPSMSFLNSLT